LQPFYQNQDGSLQLNRSIEGLKGKLKIRVMASDFDTTSAVLKELENQLPDGTSIALILGLFARLYKTPVLFFL
jgi:hypothetical protein